MTVPSPAPANYLTDPRIKTIPFTKLKLFISAQNSSLRKEAFQCSTKGELVSLATKNRLNLDPLFTEVPLPRSAAPAVAPVVNAEAAAAAAAKAEALLAAEKKAAAQRDAQKVAELRDKVANHAEKRGEEAAHRAVKQAEAKSALTAAVSQWGLDADATPLRVAIASAKLVGVNTMEAELLLKPKVTGTPKRWVAWLASPVPPPQEVTI